MAQEHLEEELFQLRDAELALCVKIWEGKRDDCIEIGNELIRLIACLHEVPQLRVITEDLMQIFNEKPLFQYWEEMNQPPRNEYIASLIPLSVERKIDFMLQGVP